MSVFTELVQEVAAEDWETECGLKTKWSNTGNKVDVLYTCRLALTFICIYFSVLYGIVMVSKQFVYSQWGFSAQAV